MQRRQPQELRENLLWHDHPKFVDHVTSSAFDEGVEVVGDDLLDVRRQHRDPGRYEVLLQELAEEGVLGGIRLYRNRFHELRKLDEGLAALVSLPVPGVLLHVGVTHESIESVVVTGVGERCLGAESRVLGGILIDRRGTPVVARGGCVCGHGNSFTCMWTAQYPP